MGLPSLSDKIAANRSRHQELIATIHDTEFAKPALSVAEAELSRAREKLAESQERYRKLDHANKALYNHLQHLQHEFSSSTRLLTQLTHPRSHKSRMGAQVQSARQEYETAYRATLEAAAVLEADKGAVSTREAQRAELALMSNRHTMASDRLKALYEDVFAGPTPGFPEEDEAEGERDRLRAWLAQLRPALNRASWCADIYPHCILALERSKSHFDKSMSHGGILRLSAAGGKSYKDARVLEKQITGLLGVEAYPGDLPTTEFWKNLESNLDYITGMLEATQQRQADNIANIADAKRDIATVEAALVVQEGVLEGIRREIMEGVRQGSEGEGTDGVVGSGEEVGVGAGTSSSGAVFTPGDTIAGADSGWETAMPPPPYSVREGLAQ